MTGRYVHGKTPDRRTRKQGDIWTKTLRWLGVASWVLMFAFLAAGNKNAPGTGEPTELSWSVILGRYIFDLMILGLLISVGGFMIIMRRNRRRTDEFAYSVLIVGLVSVCGIVYYLLFG